MPPETGKSKRYGCERRTEAACHTPAKADDWIYERATQYFRASREKRMQMKKEHMDGARVSKQHKEADDEGDCGDGSGCGNGRGEANGAARAADSDKRSGCSDSCVGIHR